MAAEPQRSGQGPAAGFGPPAGLTARLRRFWPQIAVVTLLVTGSAALAANNLPNRYIAAARVIVTPTALADPAAPAPGSVGGRTPEALRAVVNGEIAVIGSDRLLEMLVVQEGLYKDLEFRSGGLLAGLWPGSRGPAIARTVRALRDRLDIRVVGRSNVLAIEVETGDPWKSERLANRLAELYATDLLDRQVQANVRRRQWLAGRLARLRAHQPSRRVSDTGAGQAAAALTQRLRAARKRYADQKRQLKRARGVSSTRRSALSIPSVRASAIVQRLLKQKTSLRKREREFASRLGELHPETIELSTEIETIRNRIDVEVERVVDALEDDTIALAQQIRVMRRDLSRKNFAAAARKSADATTADAPRAASERLYQSVLKRMAASSRVAALQVSGVELISRARAPLGPSSPRPGMIIALGFVLSAAAAILFVAVFVRPAPGFVDAAQLERVLGGATLALVPRVSTPALRGRLGDLVIGAPGAPYVTAVESLWEALTARSNAQVVAMTSARAGEGKTSLAVSLARVRAKTGGRILLIDGDLRRPAIAGEVGLAMESGLVDLFSGQAELERVIQRDSDTGLHVLAARSGSQNPPDIFGSHRMRSLIETLKQSYDAVILDSPAIGETADAEAIARLADACIFVVERRRTPQHEAVEAYNRLISSGARIAGIVLQKARLGSAGQMAKAPPPRVAAGAVA